MPLYRLEEGSVQWNFFHSRAKVQVFGGGFANGKTTALVAKAIKVARDYPGSNILLARDTYPKLNDTLRKVFLQWCPPMWVRRKPTKDDNTCYLSNGTVVNFRYISQRGKQNEDGSTTSNLLSATFDFIGVDQIEDPAITYKDFTDLMGRLRGNTPYRPPPGEEDDGMPRSGPRWLCVTCNPTHNWVYKELVLPYHVWRERGQKLDNLLWDTEGNKPLLELFEGSTYTNQANLASDYIRGLEGSYRGQNRQRYLMGEWAAFEGLVYPEFDEVLHMPSREEIMAYLRQCRERFVKLIAIEGYDFGIISPSCYLFGVVDHWGRIFIIDGFYRASMPLLEQASEIQAIRDRYSSLIKIKNPVYADPDIFKRKVIAGHKAVGIAISKIFHDDFGIYMRPSDNDIKAGIAKVGAYLTGYEGVPNPFPTPKKAQSPYLFIARELQFVADEMQNYFWKQNPQGQRVDEPMDRDDHSLDTIKYMVGKLPDPSKVEPPKSSLPKPWQFWREVEQA